MDEDEKYKINSIFKYIKTGKLPRRKNLFKTLFYLCGCYANFHGVYGTSSSTTLKRQNKNRVVKIKVSKLDEVEQKIQNILNEYLIDWQMDKQYCLLSNTTETIITIYYKYENIKWALLDKRLKENHSENIEILDGIPKIINFKCKKTN